MANYTILKNILDRLIYTNTRRSITGDLLNGILDDMINALGAGYQYMGKATPSGDPGTPDYNVAYLATVAGSYQRFGGLTLAEGEVAFLKYDGTWMKDLLADFSGTEKKSNKVTTLSAASTNDEYPSALCVYRLISNMATPFGYEVVNALPTASAETRGIIYLVTDGDTTNFYITEDNSGSYSWIEIGSLDTSVEAISSADIDALFD